MITKQFDSTGAQVAPRDNKGGKVMRRVYGWLKLFDGSELDLAGQTLTTAQSQIAGRGIRTFRTPSLGKESNVFVTNPDEMLLQLSAVRALFRAGK